MKRVAALLTISVLAMAMLGGCAEKFTAQNYEVVFKGMPAGEVQKTLGKPGTKGVDEWVYTHVDPAYTAHIKFKDGKVIDKTWSQFGEDSPRPHESPKHANKGNVTETTSTHETVTP